MSIESGSFFPKVPTADRIHRKRLAESENFSLLSALTEIVITNGCNMIKEAESRYEQKNRGAMLYKEEYSNNRELQQMVMGYSWVVFGASLNQLDEAIKDGQLHINNFIDDIRRGTFGTGIRRWSLSPEMQQNTIITPERLSKMEQVKKHDPSLASFFTHHKDLIPVGLWNILINNTPSHVFNNSFYSIITTNILPEYIACVNEVYNQKPYWNFIKQHFPPDSKAPIPQEARLGYLQFLYNNGIIQQ